MAQQKGLGWSDLSSRKMVPRIAQGSDALMQVVSELQARSAGGVLPHQEACNVLWGLAALDQLTRSHLEQFLARLMAAGAVKKFSKAEAMQLRQVISIMLF